MLTPNKLILNLEVLTSVPILVKIDQEMRPWECSQMDRYTDRCKPMPCYMLHLWDR